MKITGLKSHSLTEQVKELAYKGGGGGRICAENYSDNLNSALNAILSDNTYSGYTIDCTYFKGNIVTDGFTINYPCVILLGACHITSQTSHNVFTINSSNVQIIGVNRTTDYSDTSKASTIISMTDAAISNDCDKGFHIYSKGNKCLTIANINFIGKKSTLGRQCNNATYPIDGYGGIYIEKAKPSGTESGNTCNATRIENCLISGTKHHGIYLDTGILSEIKDVGINRCGGHGMFLNGGTTINLQNCYVASGNLAGYCIYQVTYCSIINCVAEEVSLGFWIRSSFNVTLHSPGIETTYPQNNNPWSNSQPVSGKYGFNMSTTDKGTGTTSYIKDVDGDSKGWFIGHGYVISGGNAINVFSPYAMRLQDLSQGGSTHNSLRFIYIVNNARNVNITNARFNDTNSAATTSKHDIEINGSSSEGYPKGINLLYNPADSSFDQHGVSYDNAVVYGTNASSPISPVFVHTGSQNVNINIGTKIFANGKIVDFNNIGTASEKNYSTDLSTGHTDYIPTVGAVNSGLFTKQNTLVSGRNIKTIGGTSILGSGNIPFPTVDSELLDNSTNAVQNKVVKAAMDDLDEAKVDKVTGKSLIDSNVASRTSYSSSSDTIYVDAILNVGGGVISGEKGLSTNDYTTAEKNKLAGIADNADVNVQSDWTESNSGSDAYIKNKPSLGTAAAKSTGYIDESIPVIGETLVAGNYAYVRNDMQLGSKALPVVSSGVDGLMPYSAYLKLQGIETGTQFSGFDNTEVNGENLSFNLKSVQLPTDIDVTNLFNGSNVTGLTINANFFSLHRFVVRRTYGSKTMIIPVQMTVEDSDYRLTFYYVKGNSFNQGKLTYVYASFTLGTNSLVYDSNGTFDIQ